MKIIGVVWKKKQLGDYRNPRWRSNENLEQKVIELRSEIQLKFSSFDIEAQKKLLYDLLIVNTPKKAQINRKGLINIKSLH